METGEPHILMAVLRLKRRRRGTTQAAVAERMGVSQSRVSAIETSEIKAAELGTLARYVYALGGRLRLDVVFEDGRSGDG